MSSFTQLLPPWLVFPCTVWKVPLGVLSCPQPCSVGQSPACLSLCSSAGLPLCAAHLEDQKSPAWPWRKYKRVKHDYESVLKTTSAAEKQPWWQNIKDRSKAFMICSDAALWFVAASECYLLSPRFGVFFLPLPHGSDEFHEDRLPVLHLLYGLKSGISAVLHCKFTKCRSVKMFSKNSNTADLCVSNSFLAYITI